MTRMFCSYIRGLKIQAYKEKYRNTNISMLICLSWEDGVAVYIITINKFNID